MSAPVKRVSLPAFTARVGVGRDYRDMPARVVELRADERDRAEVFDSGQLIGFVWKGSRTYSPPTHKGSRIVRYHKQVSEWHAGRTSWQTEICKDTRREALLDLIARAELGDDARFMFERKEASR